MEAIIGVKRLTAGLVSCGMIAPAAVSAAPLEVELGRLLTNHPNIRAAYNALDSSVKGINLAKAARLPTLSVSGDASREIIDSPSSCADQGQLVDNKKTATFTLTQKLFDGHATQSAIRIAGLTRDLSAISL